jgi:hypothetical protein
VDLSLGSSGHPHLLHVASPLHPAVTTSETTRRDDADESLRVPRWRGKGPSHAGCVPRRGLGLSEPEVATVRIAVSWVATPYSLVDLYRRFAGPSYLHLQSRIEI